MDWARRSASVPRMSARPIAPLAASTLLLALVALVSTGACEGRARSASERLRDAVIGYNDELRFGRQDLAMQRVDGTQRSAFVGGHYRWGRGIEIADYEVVNVEVMGEEVTHAVSFVTVRWIATGTMIVRETLLRQEWRKRGQSYLLIAETVIDGDASLIAIPEGFVAQTSGLVSEEPDAGTPDAATDAPATP